jgi:hypothetical protein
MKTELLVGDSAVVITPAKLRREPNGTWLETLDFDTKLIITGGPIERAGLIWWQVRNGRTGWIAEQSANRTILIDRLVEGDFGRCLRFVLREEGGLSTDPHDPGGVTLWGISQEAHPYVRVSQLTMERMRKIYHDSYWVPSGAAMLPFPLNLTVFDFAVNAGVGTALLASSVTGTFDAYNEWRRYFYRTLSNYARYGVSWMSRVDRVQRQALLWR